MKVMLRLLPNLFKIGIAINCVFCLPAILSTTEPQLPTQQSTPITPIAIPATPPAIPDIPATPVTVPTNTVPNSTSNTTNPTTSPTATSLPSSSTQPAYGLQLINNTPLNMVATANVNDGRIIGQAPLEAGYTTYAIDPISKKSVFSKMNLTKNSSLKASTKPLVDISTLNNVDLIIDSNNQLYWVGITKNTAGNYIGVTEPSAINPYGNFTDIDGKTIINAVKKSRFAYAGAITNPNVKGATLNINLINMGNDNYLRLGSINTGPQTYSYKSSAPVKDFATTAGYSSSHPNAAIAYIDATGALWLDTWAKVFTKPAKGLSLLTNSVAKATAPLVANNTNFTKVYLSGTDINNYYLAALDNANLYLQSKGKGSKVTGMTIVPFASLGISNAVINSVTIDNDGTMYLIINQNCYATTYSNLTATTPTLAPSTSTNAPTATPATPVAPVTTPTNPTPDATPVAPVTAPTNPAPSSTSNATNPISDTQKLSVSGLDKVLQAFYNRFVYNAQSNPPAVGSELNAAIQAANIITTTTADQITTIATNWSQSNSSNDQPQTFSQLLNLISNASTTFDFSSYSNTSTPLPETYAAFIGSIQGKLLILDAAEVAAYQKLIQGICSNYQAMAFQQLKNALQQRLAALQSSDFKTQIAALSTLNSSNTEQNNSYQALANTLSNFYNQKWLSGELNQVATSLIASATTTPATTKAPATTPAVSQPASTAITPASPTSGTTTTNNPTNTGATTVTTATTPAVSPTANANPTSQPASTAITPTSPTSGTATMNNPTNTDAATVTTAITPAVSPTANANPTSQPTSTAITPTSGSVLEPTNNPISNVNTAISNS